MITPREVHLAIQKMNSKLPVYSGIVTIDAIAGVMHVNSSELLQHLDILYNMGFIGFTDKKNEKIKLTFTGKFAQTDEFADNPLLTA